MQQVALDKSERWGNSIPNFSTNEMQQYLYRLRTVLVFHPSLAAARPQQMRAFKPSAVAIVTLIVASSCMNLELGGCRSIEGFQQLVLPQRTAKKIYRFQRSDHHASPPLLAAAHPDHDNRDHLHTSPRRQFLRYSVSSLFLPLLQSFPASASGLIQFPLTDKSEPLKNIYHFMRAGTSLLEEEDIYCTNPLFLTNREAALSDKGRQQVLEAAQMLAQAGIQPSQVRHSLAAAAMDTAGILRDALKIGQNRINPEFVFMDPRAIGLWDGMSYADTVPAMTALDETEAGPEGRGARPPPNEDGTPNETLFDQRTRLVQLLSGLETQYSGDTILLVFPDATGPALLSCLMAGIPLNQVHRLDLEPGEIRYNVNATNTWSLLQEQQQSQRMVDGYQATLKRGQQELVRLQTLDPETVVSKKDEKMEQEQLALEEELRAKADVKRRQDEIKQQERLERQNEIEAARALDRRERESSRNDNGPERGVETSRVFGSNSGGESHLKRCAIVATSLAFSGASAAYMGVSSGSRDVVESVSPKETGKAIDDMNKSNSDNTDAKKVTVNVPPLSSPTKEEASISATTTTTFTPSWLYDSPISAPATTPIDKPFLTDQEKADAAKIAMKEYLDRDDGRDDWLRVIDEILVEDEQPEENQEGDNRKSLQAATEEVLTSLQVDGFTSY